MRPVPKDRPDYGYWSTPRSKRQRLDCHEIETLTEAVRCYSVERFTLGQRFRLVKDFCGIPKGTGCTVVDVWPNTTILWDAWGPRGSYGRQSRHSSMSFELDVNLEYAE